MPLPVKVRASRTMNQPSASGRRREWGSCAAWRWLVGSLLRGLIFGGFLLSSNAGCHTVGNPSRTMVPLWYQGNPWGLDANQKRADGRFKPAKATPRTTAWEAWGHGHLQSGDVLFRMGDARVALGLFKFSEMTAEMSESVFSHTGIVAKEGNELVVYDISSKGPSRQPFGIWMLDVVGAFGVKRLKPEFAGHADGAVEYCRANYLAQTPYDLAMAPDPERLYCVEMTENAYRTTGLPLSEPIRIDRLPRFQRHSKLATVVEMVSGIKRSHPVFMPGSDRLGIWSSPVLQQVYYAPAADQPLPDGVVLRPRGPGFL